MTTPETEFISILALAGLPIRPGPKHGPNPCRNPSDSGLSDIVIFPGTTMPLLVESPKASV